MKNVLIILLAIAVLGTAGFFTGIAVARQGEVREPDPPSTGDAMKDMAISQKILGRESGYATRRQNMAFTGAGIGAGAGLLAGLLIASRTGRRADRPA